MSLRDVEWRKLGACRGLDASIFYPDDDDDAAVAKAVCEGCGVRAACLEHALASGTIRIGTQSQPVDGTRAATRAIVEAVGQV